MFNRTLQRPMFRIGGSAGTGITTGLNTPKRGRVDGPGGYAGDENKIARMQTELDFLKENVGERPKGDPYPTAEKYPYKASDFFMGLGQGILAQPGGQPIFQTIGKASIPALGELQKAQQSDWGLGEKGKLEQWKSDQELLLAAYKNTSEDEKNKMWEEAHAMFDNKGINPYTKEKFKTPQEAYNLLLKNKFMSKEKVLTPEAQYNTTYEKIFTKHLQNQDFGGNSAAAANLAKHEANIIYEKYPKEVIDQFNLTQLWIDPAFYDEKDGVKTMNEIGEISALGIETGKIYLNLPDGNFYKLGPNKIFEQVSLTDLQG